MASFSYRAVHPSGRIQKGHMTAANENELAFYLRQLDLELIEAKNKKRRRNPLQERVKPGQRAELCSQLEDLLRAGLPFSEAFAMLLDAMPPGLLHNRLIAIAQNVQAGHSVSEAFAAHPHLFDPVFLSILKAGEQSGDLATTFGRLARHRRQQRELKRALVRALRYPLFLFCVAFGVTSFMMGFVVPEIVSFLSSLGNDLPLLTRLLMGSAKAFGVIWWSLPLFLLLSGLFFFVGRRLSAQLREASDGWLLRVPGLGPILRKLALARFATSLELLLKADLPLQAALLTASGTLGNRFLTARALEAAEHIATGRPLSQATSALFPPLILQMVKVGEKSGAMPKTFEEIARHYARDVKESLDVFLGALEPGLTLFVGGLLAWIVLAVLGPVYGSLSTLAGGL